MNTRKDFVKLYNLILTEEPQKTEAIVWLQGDRYDRAAKTLKLYRDGWGDKIIISGNNVLVGKGKRINENNISLVKMKEFLEKKGIKAKDLIVDDGSMNTKDQAEHLLTMAINNKWHSLIIVGSSFYQPRAFLTFLKQAIKTKWPGRLINQPAIINWDKKPSGRDQSAKIIFKEEFEKIKKYKKDLASIDRGIRYLNKSK